MARSLGESRGTFSEAAQRLERVVLSLKAQQLAQTHNVPQLKPAADPFNQSPDEIWSKNYMTVGIGPSQRGVASKSKSRDAFTAAEPSPRATKLQSEFAQSPVPSAKTQTIGDALAKPARRRSWLARIFRGG